MSEQGAAAGTSGQSSYQETPYADQQWEIVGEIEDNEQFVPMELEVFKTEEFRIDPMFADYGGIPEDNQPTRYHFAQDSAEFSSDGSAGGEMVSEAELEKLRQEYEAKLTEVREEGFQAGFEQGRIQAQEQSEAIVQQSKQLVEGALHDLASQVEERIQQIETQAVRLSLEISRKIIEQAVEINPEYIVEIVREAMSLVGTAVIKKVRLSLQDMEFVEVIGVRKMLSEFDGAWDFEGDPTIQSGCIVDTSSGEIDLQFDKAWERVKENIVRFIR